MQILWAHQCAVLDDYQNVTRYYVSMDGQATVAVFNDHLSDATPSAPAVSMLSHCHA